MYKFRKDYSGLVTQIRLKAGGRYYFHVYLWETQEAFDQNTLDNNPGESAGSCNLAPSVIDVCADGTEKEIIRPKLGEVHFISGKWTLEIVAHELCHALIHKLRMIEPYAADVVEQKDDTEEDVCYMFGWWVDQIYRMLWEADPPQKKTPAG